MSCKCSKALSSQSGHSCSWCSEWPPSLGMTQMYNRGAVDISSQNMVKVYCLCFQTLRPHCGASALNELSVQISSSPSAVPRAAV